MLQVCVALPSGKRKALSITRSSSTGDLKVLAQESFEQGSLKLVASSGRVLRNLAESLEDAGVRQGDFLTAIAQHPKVAATDAAFATWCCGDDAVSTWGDPSAGGDRTAVENQLRDVQEVGATAGVFAAVHGDGSVVAWGDQESGGDSSDVRDQLTEVHHVEVTLESFAAIRSDGSVVTWGEPTCGDRPRSAQECARDSRRS